jgi:5-methylcytosine-specific restriction protein A
MRDRREFPARVMVDAFKRSGGNCERCTARLYTGKFAYDHVIPDQLGGEPTLENCQVLCSACHSVKTRTKDVPAIAKAKRIERVHIGAKRPSGFQSKYRKKMNGSVVLR